MGLPAAGSTTLIGEIVNALLGCVLVYAALFGVGELLLGTAAAGVALLLLSIVAAIAIAKNIEPRSEDSAAVRSQTS
jgi:membrane protein implicated in regulation of membrane protease activity